jgi:hypothetical protein
MLQPAQTPTLKQMMFASTGFKVAFYGTIFCLSATIILGIILPFLNCSSSYYYSCSYYYSSYYYECTTYGTTYCCSSGYSYCGDSRCIYKPSGSYYYNSCWGMLISIWVLSGLTFVFACIVLVMFCNIRNRFRNQVLYQGQNNIYPVQYNQQPWVYAQPTVVYPQPQPPQVYQAPYSQDNLRARAQETQPRGAHYGNETGDDYIRI